MEPEQPASSEAALRQRVRELENRLRELELQFHAPITTATVQANLPIATGVAEFSTLTASRHAVQPLLYAQPLATPSPKSASGDELGSAAPSAAPDVTALPPFELKAFRLLRNGWGEGWELRPAPARRVWMDEHTHAYHCLPLVIANQWGWQLLCPADTRVIWTGGVDPASLRVEIETQHTHSVKSQFGQGIFTFSPPWLFRTPPGWDLMVKGPVNRWKPNCAPLEGIIETWWLPYTFTMNWKLVEPGEVLFKKGESICQLIPIPHATFRNATALELPIEADPALAQELARWRDERRKRAGTSQQNHLMYRKAETVEGHLNRVPVPPADPAPDS